jgi:DNA-binding NarL/FixJ family response regulator
MIYRKTRGMESKVTALIISRPGQLRDSLQVLLAAIPQVEVVRPADDSRSALVIGTQCHPGLVLIDYDLNHEADAALGHIKAEWPHTRCIVLANDERDHPAAQAAGADVVLMKGVLASKFYATIEELLSRRGT